MRKEIRVFTLEEANALIPEIETQLAQLETKHETFQRLEDHLFFEEILERNTPPETQLRELEECLLRLEEEIKRIRELGCLLRHPLRGWVDFLAREGDNWFCYCWRRGEKGIQYYHSLNGGFFERQPLQHA